VKLQSIGFAKISVAHRNFVNSNIHLRNITSSVHPLSNKTLKFRSLQMELGNLLILQLPARMRTHRCCNLAIELSRVSNKEEEEGKIKIKND